MILHHYPMSPFSEKIRLMCGYAGVAWQGVINPEMPPRPILDPMLGGYRKIPVAQLGADLFCDTRLIAAEIAAASGMPELDPGNCDEAALGFSAELEGEVFWACVASIPARQILRQLVRNLSVWGAFRFIRDRAGVARKAVTKPMSPKEAVAVFDWHLRELDDRLATSGPYLFGETPCHTDFAAYHTLWFQHVVGELPQPEGVPAVEDWYRRMGEIGHGECREISAQTAFEAARVSEPRSVPATCVEGPGSKGEPRAGDTVTISPADYALDGTTGELVGADQQRWIIARATDFGRLHVHFPRTGFSIR
jgi:glutathione S-transferase